MTPGARWGSVVAVLLLVVAAAGCSRAAPTAAVAWQDLAPPTADAGEPTSLDELDRAVAAATTRLFESPSFQVGQMHVRGDAVHASSWVRYVGTDTFEHVAFTPASRTPTPGAVETHAAVVVDGQVRGAGITEDVEEGWGEVTTAASDPPPFRTPFPFNVDLHAMASGVELQSESAHTVTVHEAPDGTRVWALEDETGFSQSWVVAPDGHLQSILMLWPERSAPSGDPDADEEFWPPPVSRAEIRFLVDDDATIEPPATGSALDLDRFAVWEGLPRPGDAG